MKNKTTHCFLALLILFLLPLLVTGCGGSDSDKKAGKFIPPKQNSVDAVLQQKKAEADLLKGKVNAANESADKQKDTGEKTGREESGIQNRQDNGIFLSAQKMKELEKTTPRHDVFDLQRSYTKVDYDFSRMDKTMMYTHIYNMLKTPDKYKGKVVRMQGTFGHYYDEKNGKHYFGCVVMDATACCSTGMEFSRKGRHHYPENYPKLDEPIIVTGRFSSYKEGKELFCELADAEMEKL